MSTLSELKHARRLFIKCPAKLKIRSLGTLEAGIHRYFLASKESNGYRTSFTAVSYQLYDVY